MEVNFHAVTVLLTFLLFSHISYGLVSYPEPNVLSRTDRQTEEEESLLLTEFDTMTSRATILIDVKCEELHDTLEELSDITDTHTGIKVAGHPIQFINADHVALTSIIQPGDCERDSSTTSLLSELIEVVEMGMVYAGPAVFVIMDDLENGLEPLDSDVAHVLYSGIRVSFVLVNTANESSHIIHRRAAASTAAPSTSSIYGHLARISGGQVINTNKANIGSVVNLLSQTTKPNTVNILQFTLHGRAGTRFQVPIDETIHHFMVQLQTDYKPPAFVFAFLPLGIPVTFSPGTDNTRTTLGDTLFVMEMNTTQPMDYGGWKFEKMDTAPWHIQVTAQSKVTFTHVFLEKMPFGTYPIKGRPIAGSSYKLSVTVPQYSLVQSVTTALFLRGDNTALMIVNLINVGGRRGKSLFYAQITMPAEDFNVAIEGVDKSGNLFRRMDTVLISPISIRLSVPSMAGVPLYKAEMLDIPFTVSNAASKVQDIDVKLQDNRGFSQPPVVMGYTLPANGSKSATLRIRGGNIIGETVTVTVTASPAMHGQILQGQYEIMHFTVEERHKKPNDTTDPTCNVTKVVGTCQIGTDLCKCNQYYWTMDVEVGDAGFGLRDIFTTGGGSNSSFSHDNFTVGHTLKQGPVQASIGADCCHQNAAIQVEDKAGNVAQCSPNITQNFKPPDPKLCNNTNQNITIPCKSIHTTGTCKMANPCDCHTQGWHIKAEFDTVGWNLYSAFTRGAGTNSSITRNVSIVELDSDCCHQQIIVVGIDIANNVGECNATLSNFRAPNITDCTTTISTTTTTTTSTTTPTTPTTTPTTTTTKTPTTTPTTTTPTKIMTTTATTTTKPSVTTATSTSTPSAGPPISTAKVSIVPPISTAKASIVPPISTVKSTIVPPISTAKASAGPPISTAKASMVPPISTSKASIGPPISTAKVTSPHTSPTPASTSPPTSPSTSPPTSPSTSPSTSPTATTTPLIKSTTSTTTTTTTSQSNGNELSRGTVAGVMAGAGLACLASVIVMGILFCKAKSKIKPHK